MWTLPTLFVKRWIHTHIKTKTDGWALYIWEDDFSHIALTVNLLPFFHGNTKLRDNKFALICISPKKWKLQNYKQQTLANQSREKGPKEKLRNGFVWKLQQAARTLSYECFCFANLPNVLLKKEKSLNEWFRLCSSVNWVAASLKNSNT